MEFGTLIFNPCQKKDIDLLESAQNNYARKLFMRCYKMGYEHIPNGSTRAEQLDIPSLSERRKRVDLMMLFKTLTRKLSLDPIEFLGVALTISRAVRLRLYAAFARLQDKSNLLTYRHLSEHNLFISDNENFLDVFLSL